MSQHDIFAAGPERTEVLPHNSNECDQAGQSVSDTSCATHQAMKLSNMGAGREMLRRSLVTTKTVMAKLLPYYFMYRISIEYIKDQSRSWIKYQRRRIKHSLLCSR
jgi:hypothetical protein